MSVGISFDELLAWNDEAANSWYEHLDIDPAQLELSCDIGGATTVQDFVRHIWGAELRWGQRLAALPELSREDTPRGPLDALFNLHRDAMEIFRNLLSAPEPSWNDPYALNVDWMPEHLRTPTRRKVAAHALFHSHRHYAQLATLLRHAGFHTKIRGDQLFNLALH